MASIRPARYITRDMLIVDGLSPAALPHDVVADYQTIDVAKALATGLFTKEMAYYLNSGAKISGARDANSRLSEPAWQMSGGAMHLSHTVPNGNGKARKFSLGFRIADDGSMEMVRLTRNLAWDAAGAKFAADGGTPDTVNVLTRYVNPV